MPIISIEPTDEHPVPYDTGAETPATFVEELETAAKTVELQVELGATLELDPEEAERQQALLKEAIEKKKAKNLTDPNTAFAAAAFLRTYGAQLALDVASARAAITNKLMELANCGDPKYELKALELLGKHSDIGLFTERSEVTINYKNPEDLEAAIKERVKRLLNADVIDITPLNSNLDDELGVAEYKEGDKEEDEESEEAEERESGG
jgi:hypothetical protein